MLERHPPLRHFVEHQGHLRLDAREAAVRLPDDVLDLLLRRVRRVVGRDHVDDAGLQRPPDRFGVRRLPHGRIDPDDRAEPRIVARVEQEVAGAGLARDLHAACLGVGKGAQFRRGGDMQHMDARAGPFREFGRARHGLGGHDRRPGCDMGERIIAPRRHQALLAPGHDRGRLGMERDAQARWRDDLEAFQHRPGRGRGEVAESVPHEALEGVDAAGDEAGQFVDIVLGEQAVETVIDMGLRGGRLLLAQLHDGSRRRMRVRHLEHRGRAAHRRGGRAGAPILLVRVAGLAEMDMHVDRAGQQELARDIDRLPGRRHGSGGADQGDQAVLDRDIGPVARQAGDDRAAAEHQVRDEIRMARALAHRGAHSEAQPPSTGRSTPVIWRETEEARNRQALATSSSVETRRRA